MPLLAHSHDSEVIVQPASQTRARARAWGLGSGFWVFVLGLQPHYVCSGNFFCAQHFMHVVPIYKSFLFVCLHLFVLNVATSTWRIRNASQLLHMSARFYAARTVCSGAKKCFIIWFILIIMLNDFLLPHFSPLDFSIKQQNNFHSASNMYDMCVCV